MPLTEIKAQIEIPEGFEFDRISTKTKDGDYDISGYAIKSHNMQYSNQQIILRKIKPKKPEYRVYLEKYADLPPQTVTREYYEKHGDSYNGKVEWLSDWIEYNPPKKWPTQLVERIAAIDLAAAQWIVDHWDDLNEAHYTISGYYSRNSEKLYTMFYWYRSQQKDDYWRNISKQLCE